MFSRAFRTCLPFLNAETAVENKSQQLHQLVMGGYERCASSQRLAPVAAPPALPSLLSN